MSDVLTGFLRDTEDAKKWVNQTSGTVPTRLGSVLTPLPVRDQQFADAIASTGWFVVGEFVNGFTYTAKNQVGTDANGNQWSYNGSLPFTVTAGTVPSSPDYTNRGDAALRSELADADSTVLVGGVEARDIGKTIGGAEWVIPSGDTASDINAAITANRFVVLSGNYTLESSIIVQNNSIVFSLGAWFTKTGSGYDAISVTGKSNFKLLGSYELIGNGGDKGLHIFNCLNYDVDNMKIHGFDDGFYIDADTIVLGGLSGSRGRQGRFTNATAFNCKRGAQVLRRAEYTLWTNPQMTQNTEIGFVQEAGNTNVSGGNIQDNQNGVLLKEAGTTNANHGIFSGTNINHNIGYNLRAEDVTLGHTFSACHFFGDSLTAGVIDLIRSGGVNINSGVIDAAINIDGGGAVDEDHNSISNNHIFDNFTVINSTNEGREKTFIRDNFKLDGDAWGFNDRAAYSFFADRLLATPQALPNNSAATVIFNNVRDDNRGQYSSATGIYTAKGSQFVSICSNVEFNISGGTLVRAYTFLEISGVFRAIFPAVSVDSSGTSFASSGVFSSAITNGQTVRVRCFVETTGGTIEIPASVATSLSIVSSS